MVDEELRTFALAALRDKRSIQEIAAASGLGEAALTARVKEYLQAKAKPGPAQVVTTVGERATISRDQRGVPHITANNDHDLSFAAGYAQAQDRLWQLDYLRRQAYGALSEVFGRERLDSDILSRTLGIRALANANFAQAAGEVQDALTAFSDGVNAWIVAMPAGLPVEFELLDYAPEPWQPEDSLAILRRWWWYLTGRLNVLSTPEAVRAGIGDGDLYQQFFQPDAAVTYIVPSGFYEPSPAWPDLPSGEPPVPAWGGIDPSGSNNWAASPAITANGYALLASDPHVYFTLPAEWYEMHLSAPGVDTVGAGYPGMPFVLFGRNRHLAWGITNNICSQRDLYVEQISNEQPDHYLHDGAWAPMEIVEEKIAIAGEPPHHHRTRFAHGRPLVDHLLPAAALPARLWGETEWRDTALSLAWVGFGVTGEPGALFHLNRAGNVSEGRDALVRWSCPTFNLVLADDAGEIAYQCVGAIPLRGREYRGYRFADRPEDAWYGTIPYDGLPRLPNQARGWVASANNPTAPPNFPYPLSGTWAPEDRAVRAEKLLEERKPHTLDTFRAMQTDVHSGRAERGVAGLLKIAVLRDDAPSREALGRLAGWDFRLTTSSVQATIFYLFFWQWHQMVVQQRFSATLLPLVQDSGWGLSSQLLHADPAGWFDGDAGRIAAISAAFDAALDWLTLRFGVNQERWQWGELHVLGATHPAARTALQHAVLDIPAQPHPGGASTLASAFYTPAGTFASRLGANYRLLASLDPAAETRSICWPGQSGQPGSSHYADQVEDYLAGRVPVLPFGDSVAATETINLAPETDR